MGIKLANIPTISLFMYPGYLKVEVEAAITVDIKELVSYREAEDIPSLSSAILLRAVLSKTIVQSTLRESLFKVRIELYGYTTTSEEWS